MVVQTQHVAGVLDLQLLLACLGHVGARGAQGTMPAGLPHWFLWGNIQIYLCKLVILSWVDGAGPGGVLHMTLHQSWN